MEWKNDYFQFIIKNKYVSITDIDWNLASKIWPSVPKAKLADAAKVFSSKHGKKGAPLYQNIAENLHRMKTNLSVSKEKRDLIDAFKNFRYEN